ncbi:hypothetical protein HDU97_002877 [Phlyctochytrium planicorne]|nr:hypothetical protein HDU97_002877 [Phlyctochytrium planicorne]
MKINSILALLACAATTVSALPRKPAASSIAASNLDALAISQQGPNDVPNFWMPQARFVNAGTGKASLVGDVSVEDAAGSATAWVQNQWSLKEGDVEVVSSFKDASGLSHVSVTQLVQGLPIANAVANVNVDAAGKVISGSGSIAPKSLVTKAKQQKILNRRGEQSPLDAISALASAKGLEVSADATVEADAASEAAFLVKGTGITLDGADVKAALKFYQTPKGTLEKVWDLQVQLEDDWINAFVSVENNEVLGVNSWVSQSVFKSRAVAKNLAKPTKKANAAAAPPAAAAAAAPAAASKNLAGDVPDTQYSVVPIGFSDINDNGGSLTVVKNPFDKTASPLGWHDDGTGASSSTSGNNIQASSNPDNLANPADLAAGTVDVNNFNFVFKFDKNKEPVPNSVNAAQGTTNMFFVSNSFHDVLFHFGFDEEAGNFQTKNFGGKGKGNDAVVATAQDGSGVNNANFATPPDGIAGRMRMFLFDTVSPSADGALENDIVIHELSHGLSNRLTGGPANSNCLAQSQSGGMGEGWSDMVALTMQFKGKDTRDDDKAVGVFVTGKKTGVRTFAYSTSLQRNPLKFSTLQKINPNDVHTIGEVWSSMLFESYWNMVDKEGFTPVKDFIKVADDPKAKKGGNVDFLQLLVNGMKLQPCNPTFIQARDAIVQADEALFKGKNKCELFKGFAKRGLGVSAVDDGTFVDAFDLPAGCK